MASSINCGSPVGGKCRNLPSSFPGHVGQDVERFAGRSKRAFEEVVVVRGHQELERQPALLANAPRHAGHESVERVVG